MPYWRIAVPTPLHRAFDYRPPLDVESPPPAGARVRVPFGRGHKVGFFIELTESTDVPDEKLKAVDSILDEGDFFPPVVWTLLIFASRYYHHPLGQVALTGLPKALREGQAIPKTAPLTDDAPPTASPMTLTSEQDHVLSALLSAPPQSTHCLFGVTGSGKTEIYLQWIAKTLAGGQQALVLIPEIALTPQTLSRFAERFGQKVIAYHSQMTPKQRAIAWSQTRTSDPLIVVGTRSSIFLPLPALGLIVVDEEHDPAFKQQEGFRYSARDLAVMRAFQAKIPCLLGSATPSFETLHNAFAGRYSLHRLTHRAGEARLPSLQTVDVRHKKLTGGLSGVLLGAIRETLSRGEQTLIFLNRRGYAPTWMCVQCGWMAKCPRCDVRTTYHAFDQRLRCHHCNYQSHPTSNCPSCEGDTQPVGIGTEQLEETLLETFPQARLVRLDSDVTRAKGRLDEALKTIQSGEADILIGTQLLTKGHHFPNVTLVAIVDCDGGLFSADFRAVERMGQLITQVAGRAGRENKPGRVLLQTTQPDHPVLRTLIEAGYAGFAERELTEREAATLPPYRNLALCRVEAKSMKTAIAFLEEVMAPLKTRSEASNALWGPIPAPMPRRAGYERAQLMIATPDRDTRHQLVTALVHALSHSRLGQRLRWSVDVDPLDTF